MSNAPIDPEALLAAHQKSRDLGVKMVSVIVGPLGESRATFSRWLHRSLPAMKIFVPAEPSQSTLPRVISLSPALVPLFVPKDEQLAEAAGAAMVLARAEPARPVGLVTGFEAAEKVLRDDRADGDVRQAIFGGLVPLYDNIAGRIKQLDPSPRAPAPYRSHHEQLLHMLLMHDVSIKVSFDVNSLVGGASFKRYEVDLWCKDLRLAVEIDGMQHVLSPKQKARDKVRDTDLAAAGVKTARILASAVMSDPTLALKMIKQEIAMRTKEINL
ncbi:DUF559 domain-containing protein [Rhodomicrobium vannielii ATCC 17100]|uniref:endonuclease domain-containing protein n=1 Tax=Rhodomicrobium vannielii TaxID=1069 RepID=UPI0019192EB5|nr:DUF559 domain-containing protein [Rhodomicrobium vannielii]MBJ7532672.1 DUF559 domain-containing protein [Rhodomicrobium vannielii ATCC 17100]